MEQTLNLMYLFIFRLCLSHVNLTRYKFCSEGGGIIVKHRPEKNLYTDTIHNVLKTNSKVWQDWEAMKNKIEMFCDLPILFLVKLHQTSTFFLAHWEF